MNFAIPLSDSEGFGKFAKLSIRLTGPGALEGVIPHTLEGSKNWKEFIGGFKELGAIRWRVQRIGGNSPEGSKNWEEFAGGFEELGGIRWRVRRIGRNPLEGSKNPEEFAGGFEELGALGIRVRGSCRICIRGGEMLELLPLSWI